MAYEEKDEKLNEKVRSYRKKGYREADAVKQALVDMKRDKSEGSKPTEAPSMESEDYPYGLRLSLDNPELEKLDLEKVNIGDVLKLSAEAKVSSISENQSEGGESKRCVSLQITKIGVA